MYRELKALHAKVKLCGEGSRYKRMARITRDKDTLDTIRTELSEVLRRYQVCCVVQRNGFGGAFNDSIRSRLLSQTAGSFSIEASTMMIFDTLDVSAEGVGVPMSSCCDQYWLSGTGRQAGRRAQETGRRASTGRGREEEAGGRAYVFIIHDGIHSLTSHAYIYI